MDINEVLNEYKAYRDKTIKNYEDRINEIYSKYEDLGKINEKRLALKERALKDFIDKRESDDNKFDLELDKLKKEEEELIKKYELEDVFKMHYRCEKCKDSGFYNFKVCDCLLKSILEKKYEESGLYKLFEEENFDKFDINIFSDEEYNGEKSPRENIKNILKYIERYVENFDESFENLFFYGEVGTGKTFMSSCIAKSLLDKNKSVIYLSANRLTDIMAALRFDKTKEYSYDDMSDIYGCDLLIIDDLGAEFKNKLTYTDMFSILNERLVKKKSTIISSNLSLTEIKNTYSERIISRILKYYAILKFYGKDLRLEV